jgi:membrane fusion protein (multidrug efflux system)
VFVVKGDSAVDRKIQIGSRTDENVEVTDGLSEGDSVIVSGVIQVKPGSKVKVVKEVKAGDDQL